MGPVTAPPFRRGAPPTPQATRLMKVSLGAGVAFLIVLAALFIPIGLRYGEIDRPSVVLEESGSGPFVVTVTSASRAHPLSAYHGWLNVTNGSARLNVEIGPLNDPGPWGPRPEDGGNVTFSDADASGGLSVGDAFTITALPPSGGPWTYALSVFFIPSDRTAKPPCPCAVGRVAFTA